MHTEKMFKLTMIVLLCGMAVTRAMPLDVNSSEALAKKKSEVMRSVDQLAEETSLVGTEFAHREIFPGSEDTSSELSSDDRTASASDEIPDHSIELQGGSQTFFPAFADIFNQRSQTLGHPRQLGFRNTEGAFSQRPNSYRSLFNSFHQPFTGFRSAEFSKPAATVLENSNAILGSGNFGVIRGGTFFSEDESDYGDNNYNPFYNNGHGRPSFFYSSNPRPNYNQEQFANFRDFADINTPSNSAFSEFVVVYANKNATLEDVREANEKRKTNEPKNIIETLEMLDQEQSTETPETKTSTEGKLSKSKLKLSRLQGEKKLWSKKSSSNKKEDKDLDDPLLALS